MDDLCEKMLASVPIMQKALDALGLYQQARNSDAPTKHVEILGIQAEWLFEEASDYLISILSDVSTRGDMPRC